jgi:AbrB family looped-hinge helix DNA binding protein
MLFIILLSFTECDHGLIRERKCLNAYPRTAELDAGGERWYYLLNKVMEADVESAITVKGQATIPKVVRDYLGLKTGDRVKFFFHPDGSVVLLPKLPASSLRGMLKSRRQSPVTIDEMTKAEGEGASGGKRGAKRR